MPPFEGLPEDAEVIEYVGLPEGAKVVSEAPTSGKKPRPTVLEGMKGVTSNYLRLGYEPFKMGAEFALGKVDAIGQGVRQAGAMLGQGAAAIAGGGGWQEALEAAQQASKAELQKTTAPEWAHKAVGRPSIVAQGIGAGVQAMVKRGLITKEDAQNVGNLFMLTGVGGVKPHFAKLTAPYKPSPIVSALKQIPQAMRNVPERLRQAFPSPEARAGSVLDDARQVITQDVPQRAAEIRDIGSRAAQQAEAQKVLGIDQFPEDMSPNPRRRNLVDALKRGSEDVAQSEAGLRTAVETRAKTGIENIIPRESIKPAQHNFLVKTMEAHNAAKTAEAKNAARSVVDQTREAAVEAAKQAVEEVNKIVPKKSADGLTEIQVGEQVLERLRGRENDLPADTGAAAVRKVFNEAYKPFDADPKAVASSEVFAKAVEKLPEISSEEGRAISNFMGQVKQQIEQRTGKSVEVETETGNTMTTFEIPAEPTLAWWRGMKGDLYTAKNLAESRGNNVAAGHFTRLARMAEAGESAAAQKLSGSGPADYAALKQAYKNAYLRAFREGYVGKTQLPGMEWHEGRVNPASVLPAMTQSKNVNNVLQAFGAEAAVKEGKVPTGISEVELRALGLPAAQKIVRPYIESLLASMYELAGGGKSGATKVAAYLSKPETAKMLQAYGLDFNQLRMAALTANEPMGRLTGAKMNVAKGMIEGILPTVDPAQVGSHILDAPSATSMYKNFVAVSNDPAWKPAIDTIVINELQARIEAGKNIFTDPKALGVMESIWTPEQIKGLKVYYETLQGMAEKTAKSGAPNLPEHAMTPLAQLGQAFPVGMRMWYAGKYMAKALAKMHIVKDDSVAVQWLNDAMVNPAKEKIVMEAYRGHKKAGEKLNAAIEADRKAIAGLKKAYGPTEMTMPKMVGGAAVAGGIRKQEEEMK